MDTRLEAMTCAEAVEELCTGTDLIRWGASRLAEAGAHLGHGTDDPVDEALSLVLHALHLAHGTPDALLAARLTRVERDRTVALIAERVNSRKPAAYLIGEAWFAGLRLRCDPRALVPRSPIAELIEARFAPWVDPDAVASIAEIGTGGGCIAIACAYAFPAARVDATDLDEAALGLAAENVADHGLGERLRLLQGDLFEGLDGRYDIIVSNPPYVPEAEVDVAPAEFHHEPRQALAAGSDGLDVVRRILADAHRYLAEGGILVVEVGAQAEALVAGFPQLPFHWCEFERGGEGVFVLERDALDVAAVSRP